MITAALSGIVYKMSCIVSVRYDVGCQYDGRCCLLTENNEVHVPAFASTQHVRVSLGLGTVSLKNLSPVCDT